MDLFTTVGTILQGKKSQYLIIEEVARGGMGAIYRAEDLENERYVAVKEACLDPVACEGKRDQIRARLLHEMAVLKPCDHPNVAHILHYFAQLCCDQGHNMEAERLYERSMTIVENTLGPDHPKMAEYLDSMADLYNNTGRENEAEVLEQRAEVIRTVTR